MDIEQCAFSTRGVVCCFFIGRWRKTGCGNCPGFSAWHLYFANHAAATVEPRTFEQQPRLFMDCSFDEFRVAAEFRTTHGQLDERDEHANAQSHEFTKSNFPAFAGGQCLLPAQNALKWNSSSGRQSALICNFLGVCGQTHSSLIVKVMLQIVHHENAIAAVAGDRFERPSNRR